MMAELNYRCYVFFDLKKDKEMCIEYIILHLRIATMRLKYGNHTFIHIAVHNNGWWNHTQSKFLCLCMGKNITRRNLKCLRYIWNNFPLKGWLWLTVCAIYWRCGVILHFIWSNIYPNFVHQIFAQTPYFNEKHHPLGISEVSICVLLMTDW